MFYRIARRLYRRKFPRPLEEGATAGSPYLLLEMQLNRALSQTMEMKSTTNLCLEYWLDIAPRLWLNIFIYYFALQ
jgi:hypothetical protein